jgi:Uma2 family endonuclease
MNVMLRKSMTLEQFLAWESRQELKYEFDGLQPVAMTGGSIEHAAMQINLIMALGNRLRGTPCRVIGSELKIAVAGSIRYPDAFVFCTPQPRGAYVVTDPVVVFEILSPSTVETDLVVKNREYRATPSIQRYVILQQVAIGAMTFSRKGEDWVSGLVTGEEVLSLPEIGIEIPMTELYAGLDLTAPETE